MLKNNIERLQGEIAGICRRCGRDPLEVVLVGVTKYSDAAAVNEAVAAGLTDIAENRVQAAKEKFAQVNTAGVRKHLIGHLQSNKARDAVALFDLIQSVDSLDLALEINRRAAAIGKVQDILLQLDIAGEEQKFGLPAAGINGFLEQAGRLENIRVLGLMAMAPLTEDHDRIRSVFRRCRELRDAAARAPGLPARIQLKALSMGMSGDFGIAIEEGATMVRIGSAIFR